MPAANPTRPFSRRDPVHRPPAHPQTGAAPRALPAARDTKDQAIR